jgi:serine/threonine protein kinase
MRVTEPRSSYLSIDFALVLLDEQRFPNSSMTKSYSLPISRYRTLGLVGRGQFGKVFCARSRKTGEIFALKELEQRRFPTSKFLRELRFLLSLQHPHIVSCYAIEHNRGNRYLVMEYCEAGTMRELLNHSGGLSPLQGIKLILDTLQGLGHAHKSNIIHCDLKPENVLLKLTSKGWQAKVSDFGVAKLAQEIGDASNNTGSPGYMAPERFYGEFSIASDLYAIGVMLYEVLLGRRPFSGSPSELMVAHINQRVHIPDTLPPGLHNVVAKSLEKLPGKRFSSALKMQEAIVAALKSGEASKETLSKVLAFAEADKLDVVILTPDYPPAIVLDRAEGKINRAGVFIQQIPAQLTAIEQVLCMPGLAATNLTNPKNTINNRLSDRHHNSGATDTSKPIAIYAAINNQIWIEAVAPETSLENSAKTNQTNLEIKSASSFRTTKTNSASKSANNWHLNIENIEITNLARAIENLAIKLTDRAHSKDSTAKITLAQPIVDLTVCGDRLFIFSQQGIYTLSNYQSDYQFDHLDDQPNAAPDLETLYELPQGSKLLPEVLSKPFEPLMIAVSPHADWVAVAQGSTLTIKNLPLDRTFNLDFAAKSTTSAAISISQILAFDRHHLVAILHKADRDSSQIALVSRRGNLMWKYPLPNQIDRAIASCSNNRLILVEAKTNNLCLVELLPYRVNRLLLGYIPTAIASTDWGCIVAVDLGNGKSNLNLLDLFGHRVGRLTVTGKVLKIIAINANTFMILTSIGAIDPANGDVESTKSEPTSKIYLIDLKQLEVDIIF